MVYIFKVPAQEELFVYIAMKPPVNQMACSKCVIAKDVGQPCVTIAGGAVNPELHASSWVLKEPVSIMMIQSH